MTFCLMYLLADVQRDRPAAPVDRAFIAPRGGSRPCS